MRDRLRDYAPYGRQVPADIRYIQGGNDSNAPTPQPIRGDRLQTSGRQFNHPIRPGQPSSGS